MKKNLLRIVVTMIGSLYMGGVSTDASVAINSGTFPDAVFRTSVEEQFDIDKNRVLSDSELELATSYTYWGEMPQKPSHKKGMSLKGMEHLYNLQEVAISYVKLNRPPLGNLKHLNFLGLHDTDIGSIDVSGNKELRTLHIMNSKKSPLRSIDVSQLTELEALVIFKTRITSLDVSDCLNLTEMNVSSNNLVTLKLPNSWSLKRLRCSNNKMRRLSFPKNCGITWLRANNCELTNLDVRNLTRLRRLECKSNRLTHLTLWRNVDLRRLNCYNNNFRMLDLRNNKKLKPYKVSKGHSEGGPVKVLW